MDMTKFKAPSNYCSKEDVLTPVVVVISHITTETFKSQKGPEVKPVLHFRDNRLKPLSLNATNRKFLMNAYGQDSDAWIGKPIEVYCNPNIEMGGEVIGGTRVRLPALNANFSAPTNGSAQVEFWNIARAIQECAAAGISKEQLKAALLQAGGDGKTWRPERDTAIAKTLILQSQQVESFDDAGDANETIPF